MKLLFKVLLFSLSLLYALEPQPLPQIILADDSLKPIQLQMLNIKSNITGNIAETTYEMGFYNPNNRILEGDLQLPLLENQAIVGYALEINGHYRDAVVVPKTKAKESYENTIRQNIDPAIIEKTLGNNYKLRLYPIPSKGVKRVKIVVEEVLSSKDAQYHYKIPFVSKYKIKDFSLELKVLSEDIPKLKGFVEDADIKASASGYFIAYEKKNIKLSTPIRLEIPKSSTSNNYFQSSKDSDNWFMSIVNKKLQKSLSLTPPKHIEIIIDTSLSLVKKDFIAEFRFLDEVFNNALNCKVSLKRLDIEMHDAGTFEIKNGNWKALKNALSTMQYNGAKDLSKLKASTTADTVLFFSNGINTFSDTLIPSDKIIAINSSLIANHNNLKYISQNYINLLNENTQSAFKKYHFNQKISLTKTSKNISEVFIKDLNDVYLVIGRIDGKKGSLDFSLGSQKYEVNITSEKSSTLLARVWAKEKIDALSLRYNNNKKHINTLAKTYTIVTKDMSLIVLDRVEDYVKYEILPPKILQKEYHRRVAIQNSSTIHKKNQALEESIRLLNQQLVWYNKDFVALEKERQRRLMKEKQEQSLRRESKAIHPSNDEMTGQGGDVMPVMAMMEAPLMTASAPRKKSSQKRAEPQKTIQLKTWESNAPYLKIIKAVSKKKQLKKYYDLQSEYIHSIPFYLDMGNFFYTQGKKEEALLILSNILELDFENAEYIRAFAFKLMELKLERIAVAFFERIQALRPFEAQASRDLALCYEAIGEYQKALNTHYSILTTPWDGRFSGSKIVTINELNQLISKHSLDISQINKRLIADMPVGMRIVINWSTDNSDMDLWVIDPNDEKTYYAHRESKIGGKISNDMTRGYGPEEFMIKKALRGKYQIKVKYFASSAQNIMGETVIRAEIFTDYASKRQKRKEIVFRVKEAKEVIDIGEIIY